VYAYQHLDWTPAGMAMTVSWPRGSNGAAALIASPRESLINHMVLVYLYRQGWGVQIREDGGETVTLGAGPVDLTRDVSPVALSFQLFDGGIAVTLPHVATRRSTTGVSHR
jgi:hypothetical protein